MPGLTASSSDPTDTIVDIHELGTDIDKLQSRPFLALNANDLGLGSRHPLSVRYTGHELRNSLELVGPLCILQSLGVSMLKGAGNNGFLKEQSEVRGTR